jgi:hypothetical protein
MNQPPIDDANAPIESTLLHRAWRDLLRASPAYWSVQGVVFVGSMLLAWMALRSLNPVQQEGENAVQLFLLRNSVEALLFALMTHVGIRPALRLFFIGTTPAGPAWLGLAAWLLVVAVLSVGAGWLLDHSGWLPSPNITGIEFKSGDAAFGMALVGPHLYLVAIFNLFVTYVLWAALYLAWHAFIARRRLQAQVREARLRQLTHQLSPHFLFNAFNSIRALIFEDPQRAADLVTQLSELFRFHLQHELRKEQTLAEEWQLAERYLDLESVRLESRLRLDVDLDPICLKRQLPALSLLCLVENAIKHGIAPNREPGLLRVRARPAAEGWTLEVSNSVGAQQATLSTQTGLANLRERLALGFGDRARLQIDSLEGRFRVCLHLPESRGVLA